MRGFRTKTFGHVHAATCHALQAEEPWELQNLARQVRHTKTQMQGARPTL